MRRYKIAFFITLTAAVLLGGAAGYLVYQTRYHPRPMPAMAEAGSKISANAPPSSAAPSPPVSDSGEPKLLPVQLTPQRMQSIGVKTGLVEFKTLHNELRTTGNVEVDETRLAWVQVRFSGWIQRVFVDSIYYYWVIN